MINLVGILLLALFSPSCLPACPPDPPPPAHTLYAECRTTSLRVYAANGTIYWGRPLADFGPEPTPGCWIARTIPHIGHAIPLQLKRCVLTVWNLDESRMLTVAYLGDDAWTLPYYLGRVLLPFVKGNAQNDGRKAGLPLDLGLPGAPR